MSLSSMTNTKVTEVFHKKYTEYSINYIYINLLNCVKKISFKNVK